MRRNCSPSGWPTAEFISVLAGKACSTSENSVIAKFAHKAHSPGRLLVARWMVMHGGPGPTGRGAGSIGPGLWSNRVPCVRGTTRGGRSANKRQGRVRMRRKGEFVREMFSARRSPRSSVTIDTIDRIHELAESGPLFGLLASARPRECGQAYGETHLGKVSLNSTSQGGACA